MARLERRAYYVHVPWRSSRWVVLLVLVGCSDGSPSGGEPDALTRTISKEGGTIVVNGASLTIPEGALTGPVPISVEKTSQAVPKGFAAYSPVYAFRPSGLVFAKPASVIIQFAGDRRRAGMYWTGAGAFQRIGGDVSGDHVTASISHFSFGFVGTGSSADAGTPMTDAGTAGRASGGATGASSNGATGGGTTRDGSRSDAGGISDGGSTTSEGGANPPWDPNWGPYAGFVKFTLTYNGDFRFGQVQIPAPVNPMQVTLRDGPAQRPGELVGTCDLGIDPRSCVWNIPSTNSGVSFTIQPYQSQFSYYFVTNGFDSSACSSALASCNAFVCGAPTPLDGWPTTSCDVPASDKSFAVSAIWQEQVPDAGRVISSDGGPPDPCASQQRQCVPCNGFCIDTSSDVNNCGACGVHCSGTCALGRCMTVLADEQGVALQGIAVDAASVYFTTHYNTLSKASLMGGAITPLTTLLNLDVGTIAVDSQNVYLPSNSTLVSVPLAGGAPVPLTALTSSNGTVVVHGNRVYSSDSFLGGVVGVSTTGTQRIVYSTQGGSGIAVDDENVYWGTGSGVSVAPIAGGTPTTLPLPWSGITIAGMTGGTLYGRGEMNTLVAVPINGSSPRVLVSRPNINPDFMAVDATGVYWTNRAAGVVWKAPLAGGCPTKLYSAPGTSLFHIAVDANSVYFIAIADTGRVVRLTPK